MLRKKYYFKNPDETKVWRPYVGFEAKNETDAKSQYFRRFKTAGEVLWHQWVR